MSVHPPGHPISPRWSWVPGIATLPRGPLAWVDLVLIIVSVAGLTTMSIALIIQVFSRYLFASPTVWSEELALLVFVWVAMLAIALAVRRGEHLTLDVASKMFERRPLATKVLSGIVTALVVVTLVVIAGACLQLLGPADRQSLAGIETGLGIPAKVSWVYAALPVGLGIAAVFAVERFVLLAMGRISILNTDADQQVVEDLEHQEQITQEHTDSTVLRGDV